MYLGLSIFDNLNNFIIEKIVTIDELIEILNTYDNNIYILGDGLNTYKDNIISLYKKNNLHFVNDKYNYLNAKNIIIASQFETNYIENLDINYMQKSQAERNRINNA